MRMKEGDGGPCGRIEKRGNRLTFCLCVLARSSAVPVILAGGGGLFVGGRGASICRRPHDPRACAGGIGEQQTDRAVWTVRPGGIWHDGRRKSRNAYGWFCCMR